MGGSVGRSLSFPLAVTQFVSRPFTSALERYIQGQFDTPEAPIQGQSIDPADIRANVARVGQPARQLLGTDIVYPDLIVPQVTRFIDKRKTETVSFLEIGEGTYDVPVSDRRIGQTPIASFGSDGATALYNPNQDISGDYRADIWYNCPEVGATTGSSGLDLGSTKPSGSTIVADSILVSNAVDNIILSGSITSIPESWVNGTVVQVIAPYNVTVSSNGTINTFTGNFQEVKAFVGMVVTATIDGQQYQLLVASFTDNSGINDQITFNTDASVPFNSIPSGTSRFFVSYRGNDYEVTFKSSSALGVRRLTDTGSVDSAWTGFTPQRSVLDYTVTSSEAGDENWIGPFNCCPPGKTTQLIEYDIYFPQGLIRYDSDGDPETLARSVEVEWRVNGGPWQDFTHSFTEVTADAIGFTFNRAFGTPVAPEFRMRRIEAEGEGRVQDKINWLGLRAKMPERPNSYPTTTMAVTMRSGTRISAQTENQINVKATRQINGNPLTLADCFYVVTDSLGIPRSQIDETQINSLQASFWGPRSETFDYQFAQQKTAREALGTILGAGMSFLTLSDGLISAAREGIKPASGSVNPQRSTDYMSVSFLSASDDDITGVDVEYKDASTNKIETVECRLTGVTASKVETIKIDGVNNRTRAWRIGMRKLRKELYQRLSFSASTERDGRNFERYDHVLFCDDIPGTTQSALITSWSRDGASATVTCSELFDTTGIQNPRIQIVRHDGTVTPLIAPSATENPAEYFSGAGTRFTILSSELDFDPVTDGSIYEARIIYSDSTRVSYSGIIQSVEPGSNGETSIAAVEYSESYYADDDNQPPEQ